MMYLFKFNEEMASDFITRTCQLLSKSFPASPDHVHDLVLSQDHLSKVYMIVCGSVAEFYIRPLNTCIADLDYLVCKGDHLAFNGDFPVLPSDIGGLDNAIHCYEIEPCHGLPGFVRLRDFGEMKYNWKHKEYKLSRNINPDSYATIDRTENVYAIMDSFFTKSNKRKAFCGPAIKTPSEDSDYFSSSGTHSFPSIFSPH